ncbi:lasso peptide biosynthesis B2 protein [Streptomyces halstedii]|uniref:lasso peptide biosynthesis B2 protein n=1 Tax=Streptomyces halstedii TaxID=1944 RepID=UPI0034614466
MSDKPTNAGRTRVYYAVTDHGAAILDARPYRGRWKFMDHLTTELWSALMSGTPVDHAITALSQRLAAQKTVSADRVRRDLTAVSGDLDRARLLAPAHRAATRPTPHIHFATPTPNRPMKRTAAGAGLALALILLRCAPLRWTIACASAATRLPGRPATTTEAEQLHADVRHVARVWPGRAACLEESLGTFLAAALTGRRCRWVLGACPLPQSAHAWVEAADTIVGQAEQDRVWPYTRVLEVERSN